MVGLAHRTREVRETEADMNHGKNVGGMSRRLRRLGGWNERSVVTLTRLFLHWSQPLRDLVWALRGRMFCVRDVHTIQQGRVVE